MKIKKLIIGIIIVTLTGCGYQPVYLNKNNSNILISKIEFEGNKNINRKIILLTNIKKKDGINSYNLILNSKKDNVIISKDKAGNASIYKMILNVQFVLKESNSSAKIFKTKNFNTSFSYSNIENKFDLKRYRKTIEENLIDNIVEEIIIFLNL